MLDLNIDTRKLQYTQAADSMKVSRNINNMNSVYMHNPMWVECNDWCLDHQRFSKCLRSGFKW